MSGKQVLYVEDNEFNRKIVRDLLGRTSYRLIEAVDGEAGVAAAQREVPALIIMDIQLPRLSGLDATAESGRTRERLTFPLSSSPRSHSAVTNSRRWLPEPPRTLRSPTVLGSSSRPFDSSPPKADPISAPSRSSPS